VTVWLTNGGSTVATGNVTASFTANQPTNVSIPVTLPSTAPTGSYSVALGVYSGGTQLFWTGTAASFTVGSGTGTGGNHSTNTQLTVPPTIVSSGHQNDPLVFAGYLDVTLYGADKTGVNDSTQAIQNAMNDAINYSMTTYVPSGTYLISNTLSGVQICNSAGHQINTIQQFGMPAGPTLVGPASGPRPTIVLKDNSAGFSDPAHPQPLIHMVDQPPGAPSTWNTSSCGGQYTGNTAIGAFDVLFYAAIRDINFKLGSNPGAIGIQYYSAQMSYMENVSVNATGGFTGIQGGPETDTWVNLDVNGGQYGITFSNGACGTNTIAGLTLENQTVHGLHGLICGTTVITGFNFQENGISASDVTESISVQSGSLSLLDGSIAITGGTQPAISNAQGMTLYVSNVYVKEPGSLPLVTNNPGATAAPTASGNWDLLTEYVHDDSATFDKTWGGGYPINAYRVINDVMTKSDYSSFQANAGTPPSDLVTRHTPGQLPWALDTNAVWVTDYGADPTGKTDSTSAIQAAVSASLNNGDEVFLPRGAYSISGTLQLNPNTKFFGIPGYYTRLLGFGWVTHNTFQPFVRTANSATGTAIVSDIGIELPVYDKATAAYAALLPPGTNYDPADTTYLSAFDWQTGKSSIMNQVEVAFQYTSGVTLPTSSARKLFQVENNGGGRWYGLQVAGDNNPQGLGVRVLSVSGTTTPLTLYGSNPEHTAGSTMYEFSGAANVRVLGIKTEGGQNSSLITIDNSSSNIQVLGVNGDVPRTITISNSSNLDFGAFGYYGNTNLENGNGGNYIVDGVGSYPFVNGYSLFKLGTFNPAPF